jgi:hypothetical protein
LTGGNTDVNSWKEIYRNRYGKTNHAFFQVSNVELNAALNDIVNN